MQRVLFAHLSQKVKTLIKVFRMSNILAVYSSVAGEQSSSRALAKHWVDSQNNSQVEELDFSRDQIPHIDGQLVQAFFTPPADLSEQQQKALAKSNEYVAQIQKADTVVIAVPLYNFGVPSTLKAWFDHIARVGVTFSYGENGPQGLLTGKKAIVVTSRGGKYKGSGMDFQMPFIKQFLGFVGITDVQEIYAEGLAMGEEQKEQVMVKAKEELALI